ncbi:unnamed protein product [Linum tenue]|nr:unnamed protein product [Linum tenue]
MNFCFLSRYEKGQEKKWIGIIGVVSWVKMWVTMEGLMQAAMRCENPVILFEHVLLYHLKERIPDEEYICDLEEAEMGVPTPYAGSLEEYTTAQPAQIATAVEQLCWLGANAAAASYASKLGSAKEMDRDNRVCIMGEDVGHYGGPHKVAKGLESY